MVIASTANLPRSFLPVGWPPSSPTGTGQDGPDQLPSPTGRGTPPTCAGVHAPGPLVNYKACVTPGSSETAHHLEAEPLLQGAGIGVITGPPGQLLQAQQASFSQVGTSVLFSPAPPSLPSSLTIFLVLVSFHPTHLSSPTATILQPHRDKPPSCCRRLPLFPVPLPWSTNQI